MKVLLSIKPQFAEQIFSGVKKYEFRKTLFKRSNVDTVVLYASSPIQRVLGEFKILSVLSNNPSDIWETTQKESGITRDFFFDYFKDKDVAHAIEIGEVIRYHSPKFLLDYNIKHAPQSFRYLF